MFSSKALLALILGSLTAVNAGLVSRSTSKAALSFTAKVNEGGTLNIVEQDRARARAFKNPSRIGKRGDSSNITNVIAGYTIEVGVGDPATDYTLMLDTGSSNTWVGASKAYKRTSTSKDTGNTVAVTYGSGDFSGEEWTDKVTLAPGLVVTHQSIGVAEYSNGLNGLDGILGLGPVDLTVGTVSNGDPVPTVLDNLVTQGTISPEIMGIYFIPEPESKTGELTFGGYDSSVMSSLVAYAPLTTTYPASNYWGIPGEIGYGKTIILSSTVGIVDTGTTMILIATDAFKKYKSLTGATMDDNTGLLAITSSQYSLLKTFRFILGHKSHHLSPNGQIWPRSLNYVLGGSSSSIYLVVADIGSASGSGLDFIAGYTFLERFYSIFDATNNRVGFATTPYTYATVN